MADTKLTAKQKMHAKKCSICNHEQCKDIESDYLRGLNACELERMYEVPTSATYSHAKAFALDDRRDRSTLTRLRRLLDNVHYSEIEVNEKNIGKLLELEAKLTGELIERRENKNSTTIDVSESVKRRMDRFIDAVPGLRAKVDAGK